MIQHRSFPTLIHLCLVYMTLILTRVPASLRADDRAQFTNCSATIQCGNLQYISWGVNRADYCGFSSGFQLTCVDNTSLQISISGLSYRVLRIDNSSRLLTAARADYTNTFCPQYLYNGSQDINPFSYSSDTLYYGCATASTTTLPFLSLLATNQFTCTVNGSSLTGYFLTRSAKDVSVNDISIADITGYFGGCTASVFLPANQSVIQTIEGSPTTANSEAALDSGFGLQWENDGGLCQSCIRSGGQCGRNRDSDDFACYCSHKSYSSTCGGGSRLKLGIWCWRRVTAESKNERDQWQWTYHRLGI